MVDERSIKQKFLQVKPFLNERARRCWAAAEAKEIGWGGISLVAKATKMHRDTIAKGMKEIKSPTKIANTRLRRAGAGHQPSHERVAKLLRDEGFSLQANKKPLEGASHPDRNAQFEFINADIRTQQQRSEPVISVDTKKKEIVGDFKNNGRTWRPKGQPEE